MNAHNINILVAFISQHQSNLANNDLQMSIFPYKGQSAIMLIKTTIWIVDVTIKGTNHVVFFILYNITKSVKHRNCYFWRAISRICIW